MYTFSMRSKHITLRQKVKHLVEHDVFRNVIIGLIILNGIILGMETSPSIMAQVGETLLFIDNLILGVFVIEIILKLYAHRWRFFTQWWRIFDFIIVGIALLPLGEGFAALRVFRVLRVLRIISVVPSMRRVVEGLLEAIPGIMSVLVIIAIVFYVFMVMGTHLFAHSFPEWFGTLGETAYTLFQIMTLESWSMGIVRPVMEVYPFAWVYFIAFIMVTTFTMLNLFIAIIVNAMHKSADESAEESRLETRAIIMALERHVLAKLEEIDLHLQAQDKRKK